MIPCCDLSLQALTARRARTETTQALRALLEQAGEGAPALAEKVAQLAAELSTPNGRVAALDVFDPYAPSVPEVVGLAVDLSRHDEWPFRRAATSFLTKVVEIPAAESRLIELISDPHREVKKIALGAVPRMRAAKAQGGSALALRIIPDDTKRHEALELLGKLDAPLTCCEIGAT